MAGWNARLRASDGRRVLVERGYTIFAIVLFVGFWLHAAGPGAGAGYDFASYLQAARAIAAGQNPYHRLAVEYAAAGAQPVSANGYVYPPLLATLLAIPVWLGLSASVVWLLWNLAGMAAVGWMAYQVALTLRGRRDVLLAAWLAAIATAPAIAIYDISLGQADMLMLALATGALALGVRGNRWAPLPLGLAIAVKPQLALLLGVWLWRREWRAAITGGAIALVGAIAPFAVAGGWAALHDYVSFFLRWNAVRGNAEYINQSLYGALLRLLTPTRYVQPLLLAPWLVTPLRYLGSAAILLAWLWRTTRQRPALPAQALAQEATAFTVILLVSPLTEDIHYCLLIAPLLILRGGVAQMDRRRPHFSLALTVIYLIFCIPRMQEAIYPSHLFPWPGQNSPGVGPLVTQLRANLFVLLALATLVAGWRLPIWKPTPPTPQGQPQIADAAIASVRGRPALHGSESTA